MDCREIERLLPDYSVGLLKPRQGEAIAAHLEGCASCSREWQALQNVVGLVAQFGALEPPPGLWNGVFNRITADEPAPARAFWWPQLWAHPRRLIASAVATVVIGGGVWYTTSRGGFPTVGPDRADVEMAGAVSEHALASSDGIFADRTGLESMAVLASFEKPSR
jgi:anti-sigma-K factor RskA